MLRLNIYKNQKEILKTYEVKEYDLMFGTVEDILCFIESISGGASEQEILTAISKQKHLLTDLLFDIFPELTKEEARYIKSNEVIPIFMEVFTYVTNSVTGTRKN